MPLPIAIGAAVLMGAKVAVAVGAKLVAKAATAVFVRGVGGALVRVGARLAIRKVGLIAVTVIKSGLKLGLRAFGSLKTIGLLTGGLMLAQLAGGLLSTVWSTIVNTTQFIVNFNLNTSDEELDQQLINEINSFYGLLGSAVGSATGYLVCGAIPGSLSFAFNPGVAAAIMRDLDDDARAEVLGHVNNITRRAFQTLINNELRNKFKSTRRFLKKNPDNKFSQFMKKMLGEENWKKWGESNRPSFTITQDVIEKKIEQVPDPGQRQFLENALEEFSDTCMESGFIIANNFDSQLAAYALMQRNIIGRPVDVVIRFDDDDSPAPRTRTPERRVNRS
ncbi:hypothetical protein NIES4103_31270 [Nostoc sp. NIES-4103]|nr:hypothetical protein NIES4103_31270 [Nostoc sp. NIES-4103]